jgi:hypothetical protein
MLHQLMNNNTSDVLAVFRYISHILVDPRAGRLYQNTNGNVNKVKNAVVRVQEKLKVVNAWVVWGKRKGEARFQ